MENLQINIEILGGKIKQGWNWQVLYPNFQIPTDL